MTAAPLWTLDALVAATGGRVVGAAAPQITGISIDSRTIEKGDAFFAIKGDRVDGHDYVGNAFTRGAAFCVVSEARLPGLSKDVAYVVVPDALEALVALARAARARSKARIAAVTGSVGKTSSKEMLKLALSREADTHASAASYNNHWGVPLSLARLPESARYGVFELGMNHAGELTPLSKLVRPHVAFITTIEPVHIEYFPDVEAIADAKAEIFSGVEPGGAAVLNRDNAQFDRLAAAARKAGVRKIVGFGAGKKSDVRLLDVSLDPHLSSVRASVLGEELLYRVGTPGKHVVENSLGVLACVKLMGADLALAAQALADLHPPKGRGQRITLHLGKGEVLLVDESYNANPASMRAAIEVLAKTPVGPSGRRIAALGDMLELGAKAAEMHRNLAVAIETAGIDLVFCAGPLMKSLWEALPPARRGGYAESAARIEPELLAALGPGDAIMIKGSNGSRMHAIVDRLIDRFSARTKATA